MTEFRSESSVPNHHEHYYELCALATSGTLTDQEWSELQSHLAMCADCRKQVQEYREIARTGMALLMPDDNAAEQSDPEQAWSPELAKQALFARIARGEAAPQYHLRSRTEFAPARARWWVRMFRPQPQMVLRYAAGVALVVTVTLSAYHLGARRGEEVSSFRAESAIVDVKTLRAQLSDLYKKRAALDEQLASGSSDLQKISEQLQRQIAEVERWKTLQRQAAERASLQATAVEGLQSQNASAVSERDAIDRKLRESEAILQRVQEQFDTLRRQRSAELLRTASLEARIEELSVRLKESESTLREQQQLLAHDRDIRELMGARELHIADVFDVDRIGQTQKLFGRIFYTRGRSLIFYAFDLDQQRGVRPASTFQAWGRRGLNDHQPISLGIFYLDNESNKRWVLKFDDPRTLAQIDAVFVTVEPRGGSTKPSGKQLLFASLRTPPNHP